MTKQPDRYGIGFRLPNAKVAHFPSTWFGADWHGYSVCGSVPDLMHRAKWVQDALLCKHCLATLDHRIEQLRKWRGVTTLEAIKGSDL